MRNKNKTYALLFLLLKKQIYCQNFRGNSIGHVETVDVNDVAKWDEILLPYSTLSSPPKR